MLDTGAASGSNHCPSKGLDQLACSFSQLVDTVARGIEQSSTGYMYTTDMPPVRRSFVDVVTNKHMEFDTSKLCSANPMTTPTPVSSASKKPVTKPGVMPSQPTKERTLFDAGATAILKTKKGAYVIEKPAQAPVALPSNSKQKQKATYIQC